MIRGLYEVPAPQNEKTRNYEPGSKERATLKQAIKEARSKTVEIPMIIGGAEIMTNNKIEIVPPHDIKHVLGNYHKGDESHVKMAIEKAMGAREKWETMSWEHRASIFLKAAELISGPYRAKYNAATMLGQSKNAHEAEIDAACETIDYLRFNTHFMQRIYGIQPRSGSGVWNRMEHRPLEGFVFALTPFNFTSIASNLPTAPAMMGNVVVWKPSNGQIYSANIFMEILRQAGLPDGVINMIFVDGITASKVVFENKEFAGLHFTGSTDVFSQMWKKIGEQINIYRNYPRIVGETGGKDFVMVHESANPHQVVTALLRGAFEYQGQKCSAASRAYIPENLWSEIKELLIKGVNSFRMGGVEDFRNFINAVIDETAFNRIAGYIENTKKDPDTEIIAGGKYDKTKGYFIEPTIIQTKNPCNVLMINEIFGPVLSIYVYSPEKFQETLEIIDKTSIYALTGSIFATDRTAIEHATDRLRNAAGNFYINDKPTGAMVDQQPFGGSRGSGTNDKSGTFTNLLRWVSPRSIKENFVPPTDFRYPFMEEE
jgi:1-pyrroline-5-carboxylate dehydrogenase